MQIDKIQTACQFMQLFFVSLNVCLHYIVLSQHVLWLSARKQVN